MGLGEPKGNVVVATGSTGFVVVARPRLGASKVKVEGVELSVVAEAVRVRTGVVARLPSTVVALVKPPSAVVVVVLSGELVRELVAAIRVLGIAMVKAAVLVPAPVESAVLKSIVPVGLMPE